MIDIMKVYVAQFSAEKLQIGPGTDPSKPTISIPTLSANGTTAANILNTIYAWSAIVAVVVIVIAGLFFVLSRGDSNQVNRARNAIIAAAAGLAIILFAFVITQFIVGKF